MRKSNVSPFILKLFKHVANLLFFVLFFPALVLDELVISHYMIMYYQ